MDRVWRKEADQDTTVGQGCLWRLQGGGFTAALCLLLLGVACFPFNWPLKLSHNRTSPAHTRGLGTLSEAGVEKLTWKWFCAELFKLWLIIIWPHEGSGWGNSSVCLNCNPLCFVFQCRLILWWLELTGILEVWIYLHKTYPSISS